MLTSKFSITLLISLILFAGTLAIVPNCINLRIQRPVNFNVFMMAATGIYAFFKRDIFVGLLIIYTAFLSLQNIYITPQFYFSIFGLIVFYLYISAVELDREIIYDALVVIAALNFIAQLFQFFGIADFMWQITGGETPGLMSNVNETSALYAITAPAFFRRNRIGLIPVVIGGLVFAHSRQGVVALSVAVAVAAILNLKRQQLIVSLAGILLCGILFHAFVKPFTVDGKRIAVWGTTLKAASLKPIAGWGFGQYQVVIPSLTAKNMTPVQRSMLYDSIRDKEAFQKLSTLITKEDIRDEVFTQAHNEYVEMFFAMGIIGLLLGLIVLIDALLDARLQQDKIPLYGLLSVIIVCLFSFSLHIFPLAIITVLYLALIHIQAEKIDAHSFNE